MAGGNILIMLTGSSLSAEKRLKQLKTLIAAERSSADGTHTDKSDFSPV